MICCDCNKQSKKWHKVFKDIDFEECKEIEETIWSEDYVPLVGIRLNVTAFGNYNLCLPCFKKRIIKWMKSL